MSVVYMIRAGENGPVKIGHTNGLQYRILQMQTYSYEQLYLIRVLDGGIGIEKWLHERFAAQHIRNEWFAFVPEMLEIQPSKHADLARLGRQFDDCKDQLIELLNTRLDLSYTEILKQLNIPPSRGIGWITILRAEGLITKRAKSPPPIRTKPRREFLVDGSFGRVIA